MRTTAIEDYLKAIYKLGCDEPGEGVSTLALAARLGVAPPSATAMVKKLDALKLVTHAPYKGVELTPAGERIALEVIRHHRLIETYLAEVLGLAWDKVHDEAEKLEHVLSDEVEARMFAALGEPLRDPHGAPIPSKDGQVVRDRFPRLDACETGARATVRRVSDENSERLRHLQDVGLVPDAILEVLRNVPIEGAMTVRIQGEERTVGLSAASTVFVQLEDAAPHVEGYGAELREAQAPASIQPAGGLPVDEELEIPRRVGPSAEMAGLAAPLFAAISQGSETPDGESP